MTRRKVGLAIGLAVVTLAGVALGAVLFKLGGSGTSTKLDTDIAWSLIAGTNDQAGELDPTAAGYTSPPRATYDLAESTISLVDGDAVLSVLDSYDSYVTTWRGVATLGDKDIVVADVEIIDAGGIDTLEPGDVTAAINSASCGKSLEAGLSDGEIDVAVTFNTAGEYTFEMNVVAVPASEWSGTCPSTF